MDEKTYLKKLGSHIAKLRRAKGFSQDRLYLEGNNFSRGTMSKIERGQMNPSIWTLRKIAKTIGVPLKKLIDFESE